MKKTIPLVLLVLFVLCSVSCSAHSVKILGYRDFIGIAKGNTIAYFSYENGWNELKNMEFKLPENCRDVFAVSDGRPDPITGIVFDNSIAFYYWDGAWIKAVDLEINIPKKYTGIFNFDTGILFHTIGIVAENRVKIHVEPMEYPEYFPDDYRSFETALEKAIFIVPDNCRNVINFTNSVTRNVTIGVALPDKVKFYTFEGYEDNPYWRELHELEFALPKKFQQVVEIGWDYIGVVVNNELLLYSLEEDPIFQIPLWVKTDLSFVLK